MTTSAFDTDGRLVAEVPCVRCGYALRGMLPGDACPECGAAVAESLRDDHLAAADPVWRGRVRRGLALLVGVAGLEVVFRLHWTLIPLLAAWIVPSGVQEVYVVLSLAWMVLLWIGAAGVWFVTESDPTRYAAGHHRLRLIVRWLTLAAALGQTALGVVFIPAMLRGSAAGGVGGGVVAMQSAALIFGLLGNIAMVLLVHFLIRLARRSPGVGGRRAAQAALALGWVIVVLALLGGAAVAVTLFDRWTGGTLAGRIDYSLGVQGCTALIPSWLGVAFAVCQVVFYVALRRRIPPVNGGDA